MLRGVKDSSAAFNSLDSVLPYLGVIACIGDIFQLGDNVQKGCPGNINFRTISNWLFHHPHHPDGERGGEEEGEQAGE